MKVFAFCEVKQALIEAEESWRRIIEATIRLASPCQFVIKILKLKGFAFMLIIVTRIAIWSSSSAHGLLVRLAQVLK